MEGWMDYSLTLCYQQYRPHIFDSKFSSQSTECTSHSFFYNIYLQQKACLIWPPIYFLVCPALRTRREREREGGREREGEKGQEKKKEREY